MGSSEAVTLIMRLKLPEKYFPGGIIAALI